MANLLSTGEQWKCGQAKLRKDRRHCSGLDAYSEISARPPRTSARQPWKDETGTSGACSWLGRLSADAPFEEQRYSDKNRNGGQSIDDQSAQIQVSWPKGTLGVPMRIIH